MSVRTPPPGVEDALRARRRALVAELERLNEPPAEGSSVGFGKRIGDGTTEAVERISSTATSRSIAATLGEIAEEPHHTIAPGVRLEDAFHFLEEHDAERVPVTDDDGRLVGVLSRSVLQRRLAEETDVDQEGPDLPPAA